MYYNPRTAKINRLLILVYFCYSQAYEIFSQRFFIAVRA